MGRGPCRARHRRRAGVRSWCRAPCALGELMGAAQHGEDRRLAACGAARTRRRGRRARCRARLQCNAGDGETVEIRGGEQTHTRVLARAEDGRELNPGQVAAYVAKYSCKASNEQITTRDAGPDRWRDRSVPEQLVQMAVAALRLSQRSGTARAWPMGAHARRSASKAPSCWSWTTTSASRWRTTVCPPPLPTAAS